MIPTQSSGGTASLRANSLNQQIPGFFALATNADVTTENAQRCKNAGATRIAWLQAGQSARSGNAKKFKQDMRFRESE